MYPYENYYMNGQPTMPIPNQNDNDRFFALPFLGGALLGGAAVGLSRPRPVFVQNPGYAPYPQPYPYYGSGYNYGNSGYYNYR